MKKLPGIKFRLPEDNEAPPRPSRTKGRLNTIVRLGLFLSCFIPFLYVLRTNEYLHYFIYPQQVISLVLGLILAMSFLLCPARRTGACRNKVPWYDILLAVLSIIPTVYIAVRYPVIIDRIAFPPFYEYVLGLILVILVTETVRRHMGWPMIIVGYVLIVHALFSGYFPGFLQGKNYPFWSLIQIFYTSSDGIHGIVLRIMATIVILFMLLSEVILRGDGSKVVMDAAMGLVGRLRGGAAKAAVLASAAFGTISGSSGANVAVTGSVTIPLMKKTGYSPVFAGAVEATASSGGGITPPVMGAVAFIIAEYLQIAYGQVVLAAFLPAVLFYIAVFMQVDLRAARVGLKGLPASALPSPVRAVRDAWWVIIPVMALVVMLVFLQLPVELSGLYAIGILFVLRLFRKQGKIGLKGIFLSFEGASRGMLMIIPVGAFAGIFMGATAQSGLGQNLSMGLISLSGGNQIILLASTALVCIFLGMGIPVVAAYVMLAILVAPALVQTGIPVLAAHLFIFYYAQMSFITPPVAVAAFVASSIAGASPHAIGFQAMRLGVLAYLVPFIFVFKPALIMNGTPVEIVVTFIAAAIAAVLLAIALEGHLWKGIGWLMRILLAAAGFSLLFGNLIYQGIGFAVAAVCLVLLWRARIPKVAIQK